MGYIILISCSFNNMYFLLALFPLIVSASVHEHCKKVKKVVHEDVCIPYVEEKCYTSVHQQCHDVPAPDCKATVEDVHDHKCLNVQDVDCDLIENVDVETVYDKYVVEKCHEEKAEVCDIVHGVTTRGDNTMDCLEVKSVKCWEEKKVVIEKKCIFSWEFDCPKHHEEHDRKEHKCHKKPVKKCTNIPKAM